MSTVVQFPKPPTPRTPRHTMFAMYADILSAYARIYAGMAQSCELGAAVLRGVRDDTKPDGAA